MQNPAFEKLYRTNILFSLTNKLQGRCGEGEEGRRKAKGSRGYRLTGFRRHYQPSESYFDPNSNYYKKL